MKNNTYWMVLISVITMIYVDNASCVQMTIEPAVLDPGSNDTRNVIMNCSVSLSSNDAIITLLELKRNSWKEKGDGNYIVIASMTAGDEPKLNNKYTDVVSDNPEVNGSRQQGNSSPRGYLSLTWDSKKLDCFDAGMYECSVKVVFANGTKTLTSSTPFSVLGTGEHCKNSDNGKVTTDKSPNAGMALTTSRLFHWLPLLALTRLQY